MQYDAFFNLSSYYPILVLISIDRTTYLEFEFHEAGRWGDLHSEILRRILFCEILLLQTVVVLLSFFLDCQPIDNSNKSKVI